MEKSEFEEMIEMAWKAGYRAGNLDGYFGCRDEYKAKFPDDDPYA